LPDNFPAAAAVLLNDEGSRYVPEDHGRGPSKYGITFRTAQAVGFFTDPSQIAGLTYDQASHFYQVYFWFPAGIYRIDNATLATKLLDLSANEGAATTIRFLQQAVDALAERPTLDVDGELGPETAEAVNALNAGSVLDALRERAAEHYRAIVARDPSEAPNLSGWLARLAK